MLTVEVGGSSVQALLVSEGEPPREVRLEEHRDLPWLVAAPGLVEGDRVRGAHHLGWMDVCISRELGMPSPPALSMNDAEAAGTGEWLLLGQPSGTTVYVGIGTGVGAVGIRDGEVVAVEFGHRTSYGDKVCGGCGRRGCLDAQIGGHALPTPLRADEAELVSTSVVDALRGQEIAIDRVVLGGGLLRAYPEIVGAVEAAADLEVVGSRCAPEYKSAAYLGLLAAYGSISA
ncbi:ROK family protein [Kribbella sp. NPDC004875]|uniref:ROK family protein n=1 Tax=Kribbella sp. NPDC004875 TaxID=3364107 RepID=UPI0036A1234F